MGEVELQELLVRAARAANLDVWFAGGVLDNGKYRCGMDTEGGWSSEWNPAIDDGDSRRLQIACGIDLLPNATGENIAFAYAKDGVGYIEPHGDDAAAACRLAVLKAAAS